MTTKKCTVFDKNKRSKYMAQQNISGN